MVIAADFATQHVAFWRTFHQRWHPGRSRVDPLDSRDEGLPMSDFSTARQKMVDGQVRPSDVTDLRIIDAMLTVPREAFVPDSQRALAYLDLDLDVSEGGPIKRFLIKPAVIA